MILDKLDEIEKNLLVAWTMPKPVERVSVSGIEVVRETLKTVSTVQNAPTRRQPLQVSGKVRRCMHICRHGHDPEQPNVTPEMVQMLNQKHLWQKEKAPIEREIIPDADH